MHLHLFLGQEMLKVSQAKIMDSPPTKKRAINPSAEIFIVILPPWATEKVRL